MFPIELVNKIFENIGEMNNQSWFVHYEINNNKLIETRILNKYKHRNLEKLILENGNVEETRIVMEGLQGIKIGYAVNLKVKLNEYGEKFREGTDYEDEAIEHNIILVKTTDELYGGYVYLQYGGRSLLDWNVYNVAKDYTTGIMEITDFRGILLIECVPLRSYHKWCPESRRVEYTVEVEVEY
jgi:hypothetical protein